MSRSLDLPVTEGVDALAQELAKLQDNGKRRIAFLGSRHVPVVDIHLIELIARSLAEEGHDILTSGSQGVNAAVIRAVLDINPSLLTVLLPQSLDRQIPEIKDQLISGICLSRLCGNKTVKSDGLISKTARITAELTP